MVRALVSLWRQQLAFPGCNIATGEYRSYWISLTQKLARECCILLTDLSLYQPPNQAKRGSPQNRCWLIESESRSSLLCLYHWDLGAQFQRRYSRQDDICCRHPLVPYSQGAWLSKLLGPIAASRWAWYTRDALSNHSNNSACHDYRGQLLSNGFEGDWVAVRPDSGAVSCERRVYHWVYHGKWQVTRDTYDFVSLEDYRQFSPVYITDRRNLSPSRATAILLQGSRHAGPQSGRR